jgi:hypothetical protein
MTRITIENLAVAMLEPDMLADCIAKVHLKNDEADVVLWPTVRKLNGWLEWTMEVQYLSGSRLHVGCIQRTPESKIEFCT